MLYMEYIQKVKDIVIEQCDNGLWHINPEWRYLLQANNLSILKFRDFKTDWYTIEDNLKLEVEKRNRAADKSVEVMSWLNEVVTTTIEPAILAEETDFIKATTEFMKTNHELSKNEE